MAGILTTTGKAAKTVTKAQSRRQKIAAEIVKRHQSGTDPVATSFTRKIYNSVMTPDPQKKMVASDKAFNDPVPEAQQLKKEYQKEQGLPVDSGKRVKELDVEKSKRIADAFDKGVHSPKDPKVLSSYNAMIEESLAQYQKLLDSGVKFEYWRGKGEPYTSSKQMSDDIRENKNLSVLATEGNFGQKNISPQELAENPLLARTRFRDNNGKPLLANDVFRAVHDYFGHGSSGTGFGAVGEDGAWLSHMKMYSPEAQKALTTETRGQNSWVNFGRQLRRPDGSLPQKGDVDFILPKDRAFGEQKIFLLPEEFSMEDYVSFWKDPKFRDRAKKVGFGAAATYLLANPNEAEGGVLFKSLLKVGDDVLTKFDARQSGEIDRVRNLQTEKSEQNLIEEQPFNWEDHYGEGGIFTMSDRLSAGESLEGVNDVIFVDANGNPDPIYLGGGQNFMRDPINVEKGDIWAAGEGAVSGATNKLAEIEKATGKPPLLAAWRMGESSSVEFAVPTTETGIKYARQVMDKKTIAAADKAIREGIKIGKKFVTLPNFKGLKDPQTILDLKDMSGDQRKAIVKILDRDFRKVGALTRGETTGAVSDAMQLGKDATAIQNVGTANLQIGKSTSPSYPDAFGGVYTGTDASGVSAVDLIPDAAMAKYPKLTRERIKKSSQPLQMTPDFYRFKVNDEFLEKLQDAKIKGANERRAARDKAAKHLGDSEKGNIDWKLLGTLGFGSGAAITALTALLYSPDAQANLFASGVKAAIKNLPMKKGTPQQFKAMLAKQKGVAGKEINAMDFDKLGTKSIGIDELESFVDVEAPKMVMAQKRERAAAKTPEEIKIKEAMEIGHELWYDSPDLVTQDFLDKLYASQQKEVRDEMMDELVNSGSLTLDQARSVIANDIPNTVNIRPSTIEKLIDYASENEPSWFHDKMPDYVPDMGSDGMDDVGSMPYSKHSLEGGENYRELYFNLDNSAIAETPESFVLHDGDPVSEQSFDNIEDARAAYRKNVKERIETEPQGTSVNRLLKKMYKDIENDDSKVDALITHKSPKKKDIYSGHMGDQPNNMAWARIDERVGEGGEKLMNVSEIQSDARGNPQLKKMLPKEWREGVLNKVIETAQEEGFDGVTFAKTARQVDEIEGWGASNQLETTTTLTDPEGKTVQVGDGQNEGYAGAKNFEEVEGWIQADIDKSQTILGRNEKSLADAKDRLFKMKLERKQAPESQKRFYENELARAQDDYDFYLKRKNTFSKRLEDRSQQIEEVLNRKFAGWELDTEVGNDFKDGEVSSGIQRVANQYTKEMPEMVKRITGEDVSTIKADNYELNYVPLKNTDGAPKKIRESKFWQAAPVVGAAGYAATQSDPAMAGTGTTLLNQMRKAATKAGLNPQDIKNVKGEIVYPETMIEPLTRVGAGQLRYEVARHNDSVLGTDTEGRYGDDLYHATGAGYPDKINAEGFDPDSGGRGSVFGTPNTDFANTHARRQFGVDEERAVMPIRMKEGNKFDYENPDHVQEVVDNMDEYEIQQLFGDEENAILELSKGDWNDIELEEVRDGIRGAGFESYTVNENGVKNTAVFDGEDVRSKNAAFDNQFEGYNNILGKADAGALPVAAAAGGAGLIAQDQVNDSILIGEQRNAFETIKHTLPEEIETLEDYKRAFINGKIDSGQYKWVIDQNERAEKLIAEQQDTVLPDEVVTEEQVVEENAPAITTPQEQERQAEKQEILRPVSEKVAAAPEGDQRMQPIPPDRLPEERYTDAYDERGMDEVKRFGEILLGMGDAGLTIAEGMAAESNAGMGGMGVGFMHYLADDFEKLGATDLAKAIRPSMSAAQMVEGMQEGYEPREMSSKYGGQMLEDLGSKVGEVMENEDVQSFGKVHEDAGEWANQWGSENVSKEFGALYGTLASKWYELQPFI